MHLTREILRDTTHVHACKNEVIIEWYRNKSVKKRVTKTNLAMTLNTSLSIMPYHFSVPLLSNQNLALSLQAVQRYAFLKLAFR